MKLPSASKLGPGPVGLPRVEGSTPASGGAKLGLPPLPAGPSQRRLEPPAPELTQRLLGRLPEGTLYAGAQASVVLFPPR